MIITYAWGLCAAVVGKRGIRRRRGGGQMRDGEGGRSGSDNVFVICNTEVHPNKSSNPLAL